MAMHQKWCELSLFYRLRGSLQVGCRLGRSLSARGGRPMSFVDQDSQARQNLKTLAQTLTEIPIEEYTREKTLGWDVGFGQYRNEIERIIQIAKRLGSNDFEV